MLKIHIYFYVGLCYNNSGLQRKKNNIVTGVNMYTNYLFDLYGTLADINTNEWKIYLWNKMAELYAFEGADYSPMQLKKAYFEQVVKEQTAVHEKYPHFTHIDIRVEKVFEKLLSLKGQTVPENFGVNMAKVFRVISTKYIRLYDGAEELLDLLHQKNKKVYLLTNAQRSFTVPELKMLGIYDKFDGIVISSDEYTCKPDTAFYQTILHRYCLDPSQTIMIGNDCITDILGSYNAGLDSLYIHSNISPPIRTELQSRFSVMDGDVKKIKSLIIR